MAAGWLVYMCVLMPQVLVCPVEGRKGGAGARGMCALPTWSRRFCLALGGVYRKCKVSSFCACLLYMWGLYQEGGGRRMRVGMEEKEHGKSSGRSSQLFFTRCRSLYCCRRSSRGSQMMVLIFSWFMLLLLLDTPGLAGADDVLVRADEHSSHVEDWNVDSSKGTDIPTYTSRRRQPSPERAGDDMFGKSPNESQNQGREFSSAIDVVVVSDFVESRHAPNGDINDFAVEEEIGAAVSQTGSAVSDKTLVSGLSRDCFKVACSLLVSSEQKQGTLDNSPRLVSDGLSSTLQGPVSSVPNVAITPPFLEWASQPLFSPSIAILTVANTCNSTGLRIYPPFSTDKQFYTFGFQEKVVEPGAELSIPIVFLPRIVGMAEAMLIVQTSAGGFLVQAQGKGISSPYNLRSLQGLRIPLGQSIKHIISLHNPYDQILRVSDVYTWPANLGESSFTDSHSEAVEDPCSKDAALSRGCPDKSIEVGFSPVNEQRDRRSISGGAAMIRLRPLSHLTIEPHSTNAVAELEFWATGTENFMGSIHIRVSRDSVPGGDDILMLPVDVQVGSVKGGDDLTVEPIPSVLEFGLITRNDETSTHTVNLYNPGTEAVQVEDVYELAEDENIVAIEFRKGLVIPPGREAEVALVTYMGVEETVPMGLFSCRLSELTRDRKLVVQTNSTTSSMVEVPYRALVFHGSMDCHPSRQLVSFVPTPQGTEGIGSEAPVSGGLSSERRVQFENGFSVPLAIFMDLDKKAWKQEESDMEALMSFQTPFSACCGEKSAIQQSILADTELLYPSIEIGFEESRWVNVVNPSDYPVHMQLVVGSKAEACPYKCEHENCDVDDLKKGRQSQSGKSDLTSTCQLHKTSTVFSLAEGGVSEIIVEAYGTAALGPVIFRPNDQHHWTSLLFIKNNLTRAEWVPLQGSGCTKPLTFLDGDGPVDVLQLDFNVSSFPRVSGIVEEQVTGVGDLESTKAICSKRVTRKLTAKNTGGTHLDVRTVELGGGGCLSNGFEVDFCKGFSLPPGESEVLFVSYKPDFSAAVLQTDLRFVTSAGLIKIPLVAIIPKQLFPLCAEFVPSTKYERAILYLSIIALVLVLGVFLRLLVQEMSQTREQSPTNRLKCAPQHKVGGRQSSNLVFSSSNAVLISKPGSSTVTVSGRVRSSCGEPEVQSRTGDGTGASGPGRPKEQVKVSRSPKGLGAVTNVADSVAATIGSPLSTEESKPDLSSPVVLPGIRVKVPIPAVSSASKCSSGSPPTVKEGASPPHSIIRKGYSEKKNARGDYLPAKVAPEPLDEMPQPLRQSLSKSVAPAVPSSCNSGFVKPQAVEISQTTQLQGFGAAPSATVALGSSSPRKGTQRMQVLSPKSQPPSPKSQPQTWAQGSTDRDKGRRKKRRNNVCAVKQEAASKVRSGSSSPSSSPVSPATPASPSRPVSPLLHSDTQSNKSSTSPNLSSSPPSVFTSPKIIGGPRVGITPLSRLDLEPDRHGSVGNVHQGSMRKASSSRGYKRTESLTVDVASTALKEMAQAKAADVNWSALSGKVSKSIAEKSRDAATGRRGMNSKDWATVAKKAMVSVTTSTCSGDEFDNSWDGRALASPNIQDGSPKPSFTPSATFPRRQDRVPAWSFSSNLECETDLLKVVSAPPAAALASYMPPAARAPGAKIGKLCSSASAGQGLEKSGSGDIGFLRFGDFSQESNNMGGKLVPWERNDGSSSFSPGLNSDGLVYDIWGHHFGEIGFSGQADQSGGRIGAFQRVPVVESTPSFFSAPSFSQPFYTSTDVPVFTGAISGFASDFSVFSQVPVNTPSEPCLPAFFNSPRSSPPISVFPENHSGRGSPRAGIIGQSLSGSPRHGLQRSFSPPLGLRPYSPPLGPSFSPPIGPSPMSLGDFSPLVIAETTANDNSCSYWSSSSSLQEVFATPIHLQS